MSLKRVEKTQRGPRGGGRRLRLHEFDSQVFDFGGEPNLPKVKFTAKSRPARPRINIRVDGKEKSIMAIPHLKFGITREIVIKRVKEYLISNNIFTSAEWMEKKPKLRRMLIEWGYFVSMIKCKKCKCAFDNASQHSGHLTRCRNMALR